MRARANNAAVRQPGALTCAVLAITGALIVLLRPVAEGGAASATPPAVAAPSGITGHGEADACKPTDTDQTVMQTPPSGITWQLFGGVALPYSSTAGPLAVEGADVARCFARSPLGALIATDQLSVRYLLSPDWRTVVLAQVVPGPGRDAYLSWRPGQQVDVFDTGYAQVAGFRFITYTPQLAVIEKITRAADGSLGAFLLTVRWENGDWRLVLQPDGIANPPGHDVGSLNGYVPWSGI